MSDKPIYVESTEQFITLLLKWHENKVKELEHVLGIPEGVEITFNDQPATPLTGDLHKGFIMGVSLGLMTLGTLPFDSEPEETISNPEKGESPIADEPVIH